MSGLILFDCDGTLVDSPRHIVAVMREAFSACGVSPPPESTIAEIVGLSLDAGIHRLLPTAGADLRRQVAETYRRLYRRHPHRPGLHAGVRSTLKTLRERGYLMGVVSGKSLSGLERVLAEHDLFEFFIVWRTADQCPSKPHPAMVIECMTSAAVAPERTTVVGDARCDMEMAANSGVRAVGVSYGAASTAVLSRAGAACVVDRFPELLAYFPHLPPDAAWPTISP